MPLFSILIATRNRPALFREALRSVLNQSTAEIEIIVVDDGSDDAHRNEYQRILDEACRPIRIRPLVHRPNGHGQSYAVNFAAAVATGDYLAFLDDDDCWIDPDYLARIERVIAAHAPDLVFSAQAAYSADVQRPGPIWLEDLPARLNGAGHRPDANGCYRVEVEDLMAAGRFCHMNTMIVRRCLFEAVGGMDETIRWECDRDLFLRLIDSAKTMQISTAFVARHNIPDPAKAASMTTALGEFERRLYQLRVLDKAALLAAHPVIRAQGRRAKGYVLKHIAEALAERKDYRTASFYAREALGVAPTLGWAGYTALTTTKAFVWRDSAELPVP